MQSHEETTFQTLCDNRERGMLSIFIFQNHPQNATHARNPSLCDPPKLLQVLLTSPVSVFGHCRASIQSFYGANILDPTGNLGTHYETRLRSINQIEFGNLKVISFLGGTLYQRHSQPLSPANGYQFHLQDPNIQKNNFFLGTLYLSLTMCFFSSNGELIYHFPPNIVTYNLRVDIRDLQVFYETVTRDHAMHI